MSASNYIADQLAAAYTGDPDLHQWIFDLVATALDRLEDESENVWSLHLHMLQHEATMRQMNE